MKSKEELMQIAYESLEKEKRDELEEKVGELEQIHIDRYKFAMENDLEFCLKRETKKRSTDEMVEEAMKEDELKKQIQELKNILRILEEQIKSNI